MAQELTTEQQTLAMAEAAPLEVWKNVADKAAVASDDDQRLSPEALGRTARLAVAAWALAVNGDHATLTGLGPADVLYWLLHPVRKPWQVSPGPVVTRIDVCGLDPEARPPELDLSFRFTGRKRYDDRRQATGDPGGQAMFRGRFTMIQPARDRRGVPRADRLGRRDDPGTRSGRLAALDELAGRRRAAGAVRPGPR